VNDDRMRRRRRHFDDEFDAAYSNPTASSPTASTAELDGRLVLIDLPQVVDVVGNPQGPEFLARDVRRITEWFTARGLPGSGSAEALLGDLRQEAGIGP
jgi:hypothetical protein